MLEWAQRDGRRASGLEGSPGLVVALGGAGLIEHELRFGLSVGGIVGRRLIEEEVALGRATGW